MPKLVVLDPGHGGATTLGSSTPIGVTGRGGAREKDLILDLARRIREELEARGIRVLLTRDADVNRSLAERVDTSRAEDTDLFVSLHLNGSSSPAEQGSEAWIHDQASARSRALAASLCKAVALATGHANRGVKAGPLAVLEPSHHDARAGACLVELAFLSDPSEEARLAAPAYRARIASSIARTLELFPITSSPTVSSSVAERFDIWHEVPLVPQLTGMSCWAAAAAMIVGWRDCVDIEPEEVARGSGRWQAYRDGLEPEDVDALASAWGLSIEIPQSYTVAGLRSLLERCGPLWVGEASGGLHVVVVSGLYGDGTVDGSFVRVLDPWPEGRGERYTVTFRELAENLEAVTDIAGVRAQILRSDGRRGRGARARYGTPFALFQRIRTAPPDSFALGAKEPDDRDWYSEEDLSPERGVAPQTASPDATWAKAHESPDYRHLRGLADPSSRPPFAFRAEHLRHLCELNSFALDAGGDELLFGLRGCRLASPEGQPARVLWLREDEPDHYDFRCVLGVWRRSTGELCAFSGSTVPDRRHMERQRVAGAGHLCNLLPTGCYTYRVGHHRAVEGAFILQTPTVVLRAIEGRGYTSSSHFEQDRPADNIHPAFDGITPFASAGCQTLPGRWSAKDGHVGSWARFRALAGLDNDDHAGWGRSYSYVLLTGREARLASTLSQPAALARLRFGSSGRGVEALQSALARLGQPMAGACEGQLDAATSMAWIEYQRARDSGAADAIVQPEDARSLGFDLIEPRRRSA
jgi:N-acetylmuramoyl-L-alanine amidase